RGGSWDDFPNVLSSSSYDPGDPSQSDPFTGFRVVSLPMLGDFNRDGHVDDADVVAVEQALINLPAYEISKELNNTEFLQIGDINGDGKFSNTDLQSLLTLLKSGGGSANSVPEPSTFMLTALAIFGLFFARAAKNAVLQNPSRKRFLDCS